jgi:hypothetical protein
MIDRSPPPHYHPPAPVVWLLALAPPIRLALLFAYWLYMAAAGVMAGLSILGSLLGGAFALGTVLGSYVAMVEARRREWQDEPRELLWRALAGLCAGICLVIGGLAVLLPAIVVMVLALWALASLPVWLYRR